VLYNPEFKGTSIYGVPRLEWRHPLVPGKRSDANVAISHIMPQLKPEGYLATFLFEVTDLKVADPSVAPVCGSSFCNGHHRQVVSKSKING
jgi:hypothetical protein